MDTIAVVIEGPERIALRRLDLVPLGADDIVVEVRWTGISTGTERLLWSGRMPPFPGMGYPLVPGYESVGAVVDAGDHATHRIGETVFIPGATCFRDARGLFGGAARVLVVPQHRAVRIPERLGARGVLIALAATAHHAVAGGAAPDLIVGHGVLGRLLARVAMARGAPAPTVWETNPARQSGSAGYRVLSPEDDARKDYRAVFDASGDGAMLDRWVGRLQRGGEVVLAGFYEDRLSFSFVPMFMREARLRVAAEWKPEDLAATLALIRFGHLSLDQLITHESDAADASQAYGAAFGDSACLKMVLDWRQCA